MLVWRVVAVRYRARMQQLQVPDEPAVVYAAPVLGLVVLELPMVARPSISSRPRLAWSVGM